MTKKKSMIKSTITKLFRLANLGDMYAYKVMRLEGNQLISGANSRLKIPLKKGYLIKFPSPGLYLTLNRQYALNYYSGLADQEVLVRVLFNPKDVLAGNLTDKETEFAVSEAILADWELI